MPGGWSESRKLRFDWILRRIWDFGRRSMEWMPSLMLASDTPMCLLFCPSNLKGIFMFGWVQLSTIHRKSHKSANTAIHQKWFHSNRFQFAFSIFYLNISNNQRTIDKKKSSHCSIVDGIAACADIETHLLERASHELLNKHTVLGSESDWKWISPRAQWMTANLNI